jgi:hypothetical protein
MWKDIGIKNNIMEHHGEIWWLWGKLGFSLIKLIVELQMDTP